MRTIKQFPFFLALIVLLIFGVKQSAFAQRFCYVDVDYILNKIPEYGAAQETIDQLSAEWQAEIEKKYDEIEMLYKEYQRIQVLLTEEMRRKEEEKIVNAEKAAKAYQKQKFGYEGDLFKKRQELVKPIQDRVYEAIEKFAKEKRYDIIFDKSSGLTLLFTTKTYDKSNDILKELNIPVSN
ncbi:MAG: OmpH family outer membrane protein [Bacteroidetes bacterium]|nr:OmpH family outer membrane protein [Bacteroidota bacterium]